MHRRLCGLGFALFVCGVVLSAYQAHPTTSGTDAGLISASSSAVAVTQPVVRPLHRLPRLAGAAGGFTQQNSGTGNVQGSADGASSRALLNQYCVGCHNQRTVAQGRPAFDQLNVDDVAGQAPLLEKIVTKLRTGQMPPEGARRPDREMLDKFLARLEAALDMESARAPNPGRIVTHRLNRYEYANVIEDLLGLTVDRAQLLPADLAGFGFDNNADVLSITPAIMARYNAAATKISRASVGSLANRPAQQLYTLGTDQQDERMNEDMPFGTHGGLAVRHLFPLDGEYAFTIRLKGADQAGIVGIEDEQQIELRMDQALLKRFSIGGKFKGADPGTVIAPIDDDIEGQQIHNYRMTADKALELRLPVKAGTRVVSVAFTDSDPTALSGSEYGRPGVDRLFIAGPFGGSVPEDTPSRRRIFVCHPTSSRNEEPCARQIIGTLTRRAYRRPVTEHDLEPMMASYGSGRRDQDFDAGIERALETLLSMPEFLLRVERQPASAQAHEPYQISDLELASRLSFFLWSSIPDDELIDLAAKKQLRTGDVLNTQVRRMLADRRATRFMNDFVDQWLQVRNISEQNPNATLFGAFNDSLRKAMLTETELFFQSQVRDDRPVPELLDANYTYLNEKLARLYGIDGVFGSRFRRVPLSGGQRGGILGQASVLTISSYADRTSVVLRGKWVLENLLGTPPPPPPPNVPTLKESDAAKPTTLRERMQQHRANPVCASCHTKMDPLGFALENYDAIGRWREKDGVVPIDAKISLDGTPVESPKAFREALITRHGDQFVRTVAEKMLTYALGRGVDYYDQPTVRQLVRDSARDENRWSSLIQGIVHSRPFQMRVVDSE